MDLLLVFLLLVPIKLGALDSMSSLPAEVEGIVNGRPLTHVFVTGSTAAFTTNHFQTGSSLKLRLNIFFEDSDLTLRKQ